MNLPKTLKMPSLSGVGKRPQGILRNQSIRKYRERSNSLSGIRYCMDSDVEQAIAERNRAYEIWHGNVNRVKGDRNWLVFADRRRIAKGLLDARRSAFVSINLDPDLPPKKLYSNLRQLGVINGSNKVEVEVDVVRMNQFFVTRKLPQNELDFDIPVRLGVPEFSFITVESNDVFDAFMAVKSDASGRRNSVVVC
jgi:hypothetical protein